MGKKKAGAAAAAVTSARTKEFFCFWCDKDFDDERVLIQHQLNKHFRCPECTNGGSGKCNTLHGLISHYRKVHRTDLLTVPNAMPERSDPSLSMNIVSMRHVPEEIMEIWRARASAPLFVFGGPDSADAVPSLGALPTIDVLPPPVPQDEMPPAPTPGGENFALQVQAWLAAKQKLEQEQQAKAPPPLPEEPAAPPPSPAMGQASAPCGALPTSVPKSVALGPPPGGKGAHPPSQAPVSIFTPLPIVPQKVQQEKPVDALAAQGFLAGALGNLKKFQLANNAAAKAPPASVFPPSMGQARTGQSVAPVPTGPIVDTEPSTALVPRARTRSRSRDRRSRSRGHRSQSRGRRSQSPGRVREPPRPAMREPAGLTFESRTIQITAGAVGTRLRLKQEMERFGRVEVCHTGNRQDPIAEPPWVRFEQMSSVEKALLAINSGQVFFDGIPIKAELKTGGGQRQPQARAPRPRSPRRDMDFSSRDLARDDRRGREGPGNYSSRDLARDDLRAREGPGAYSSRRLFLDEARKRSHRSSSRSRSGSRSRRDRR